MNKKREYLKIKEAAKYLGVTPQTLRNWDKAGKLVAERHPINKYRVYRLSELENIKTEQYKMPTSFTHNEISYKASPIPNGFSITRNGQNVLNITIQNNTAFQDFILIHGNATLNELVISFARNEIDKIEE